MDDSDRHSEPALRDAPPAAAPLADPDAAALARVTLEEALRESEKRFRAFVENAPEAIFVANRKGRFVDVNLTASELTGYDREELRAMTLEDLAPGSRGSPEAMRHLELVRDSGTAAGEYPIRRKDGTERWISVSAVVLDDHRVLAYARDVTERRAAEQRATQAQTLLHAVIAQSSVPMVVVNPEGKLHLINDAARALLGTLDELDVRPGLSLRDYSPSFAFFEPEGDVSLPREQFPVLRALRGESTHGQELRIRRKDGTERWVTVDTLPIQDEHGTPIAGFTALHDITERRLEEQERVALEARFQQGQKLESLGVLAGGIAHDFNNLLMGVLGNAGLALLDVPESSPAHPCLLGIKTAALRAKELTSQMLAYSGRGRFLIELVDLGKLVTEMLHLLEVSHLPKVTLRTNFAESAPLVEADATQIRQVVMNLITNASEAIGDVPGEIAITTGAMDCDAEYLAASYTHEDLPAGRYAYLEVIDDGCGMTAETQAHIFEPFFTTKFNGRGLGLAAVLGIVRGHHGALHVQSALGRGTVIRVLFPAVDSAPVAARDPSNESLEAVGGATVLLVDDDETALLVGRRMLERLGYSVVLARDGVEGLARFAENPDRFAVVLLDQTMPRMDGDQCLRELRTLRPDAKVILCSGHSEQELAPRYDGLGLHGHLQKPYLPARLAKLLRQVIDAR